MSGVAPGTVRLAVAGGAIVALFAVLFTAGSALGAWPAPPVGAFIGWDLWVGIAVGAGWLVWLLRGSS